MYFDIESQTRTTSTSVTQKISQQGTIELDGDVGTSAFLTYMLSVLTLAFTLLNCCIHCACSESTAKQAFETSGATL